MKQNIIYRYDVPGELIIDNGKNLNGKMIEKLCQQFKIEHWNSVPYRPQMNGAVEAANKNIKKILVKMTDTYKDWHKFLPFALCTYRTSFCTSMGATPYSLLIQHGSCPPRKGRDPISQNVIIVKAVRS